MHERVTVTFGILLMSIVMLWAEFLDDVDREAPPWVDPQTEVS